MSTINNFEINSSVTEVAEHLYVVTIELVLPMDGDSARFVQVGTRVFSVEREAEAARLYKRDLTITQIQEGWLDMRALLMDGDWKNVPTMPVIEAREADEQAEEVKPFDSFWDKVRDLQKNLSRVHVENGGYAPVGEIIVKVGRDHRFHYFHKVGETKLRIAETTWEKMAHEGHRINVPASSVTKLFAHLSRNGILLTDTERRAARGKLSI